VNGRDPTGHDITKNDAIELSEDVYKDEGQAPDGFEIVSEQQRNKLGLGDSIFEGPETGFRARLYRNKKTGEYTLAFAGSTGPLSGPDWRANAAELMGLSAQHSQAVRLARIVSEVVSKQGVDLSFTGHSLGGGLAEAAAGSVSLPAHRQAVVFNSPGLSFLTNLRTAQHIIAPLDIANYEVTGDILTLAREAAGLLSPTRYFSSIYTTRLMGMPQGSSINPFY